jgi:hypothetical protein
VDASASLQGAIGWLKYTIETELLMNQIAEASDRISALLAGAKQYSQMDRAPIRAPTSQLMRSTVMMFGDKVGKDKPIKLVRNWTCRCLNCSAIQAISTRCSPTSSTTPSRPWTATAR